MIPTSVRKTLSYEEEKMVYNLKMRMEEYLSPVMLKDEYLYYRFLKARDFDFDKAEKMLRKNITWRKIHQTDTILEDFKPTEFFRKYAQPSLLGFDKEGNIVKYIAVGNLSIFDVMKCWTFSLCMKHWYWFVEYTAFSLREENKKTQRNAYQGIMIFDADKITFADLTAKSTADLFIRIVTDYQNNYPERMKAVYCINVPPYVHLFYNIVKPMMSNFMQRKIHMFGNTGWKEKLLEIIDADVLPAFLGGNRTDPDGDPLCKTFINHCGRITEHYFLTDKERYFDRTHASMLLVPAAEKEHICVEVQEPRSLLRWVFISKNNIGFGLFFEASELKLEEIIPIHKYSTSDGAERYFHRCQKPGKYIIIFDNSYSWINSKEVYYRITVEKPKCIQNQLE